MIYLLKQVMALWEIWRTRQRKPALLHARQERRLKEFVQFARQKSPFYRQYYSDLPPEITDFQMVPPVTKSELIEHFDEWVTDPLVTKTGVEKFLANKSLIGEPYLGKYLLYTSSGSTGYHATFLQDQNAAIIYRAMKMLSTGIEDLWSILRAGGRWAIIVASTEEHLGSVAGFRSLERSTSLNMLFKRIRIVSMAEPFVKIVQSLNEYQPNILIGYSSIISKLAEEQAAKRLQIKPVLISIGAEWLPPEKYQQISEIFPCTVRDTYAAAECPLIASLCQYNWLHTSSEYVIIEPVDKEYQPVAAGKTSYTALLTNLINHVQPIIRYDLGDSITIRPDACPCGNPFPGMRVMGRKGDILYVQAPERVLAIFPMPIIELLNHIPNVLRFQIIQISLTELHIRFDTLNNADRETVWEAIVQRLTSYLFQQGAISIIVTQSKEKPCNDPTSGKFRYILAQECITMT